MKYNGFEMAYGAVSNSVVLLCSINVQSYGAQALNCSLVANYSIEDCKGHA